MTWGPIVVTSAPSTEPLTTALVKAHLRVDTSDDDTIIDAYTAAARAHIENSTGTRLVTQTVTFKTGSFADMARLPVGPVQSISSITYTDTAGDSQTIATSVYDTRLERLENSIILKPDQACAFRISGS